MASVHDLSLSHYSNQPLGKIHDAPDISKGGACYKPAGFWISVDGEDDWAAWCEAESFRADRLQRRHRIVLATNAKVLLLTRASELFDFTARFGMQRPRDYFRAIDWPVVANHYDGLIIAPYQWDCRLDDRTNWYYGWDCASGVIWKTRAISHAEEIVSESESASNERPEGTSNSPGVQP